MVTLISSFRLRSGDVSENMDIKTVPIFGLCHIPLPFFRDNEEACYAYYDEIEICEDSTAKHFKVSFQVRNRHMVDRSNLVIFYVETNEGGAYQTMQYAIQQGKNLVNLYRSKEDQ